MKLVLHRNRCPLVMFHNLSPIFLVLIVIQLVSFVTPSLAYPLVLNGTLGNRQEGLVRRMNPSGQSSLASPGFPCKLDIAGARKRLRIRPGQPVTIQECTNNGGFAWWPSLVEMKRETCIRVGMHIPPPKSAAKEVLNIRGTCIEEVVATSLTVAYKEVHPCHVKFSLARTKQYKFEEVILSECAKTGVAFWAGQSEDAATCGLVWRDMRLLSNEGQIHGTCFVGPHVPIGDLNKGKHPCADGFISSLSPSYHLVKDVGLSACNQMTNAVAWRAIKKFAWQTKDICVPLHFSIHPVGVADRPGDCYVYDAAIHEKWYRTQVLKSEGLSV